MHSLRLWVGPSGWLFGLAGVVLLGVLSLRPVAAGEKGPRPPLAAKDKRAGAEPPDKAKQLAQEGAAALAAQDFPSAARALTAAYRLAPTPALFYPLGQLALSEGRIVEAQDFLRRYLHDTSEPEASPSRQEAQRILQLPAPPSGEVSVVGDRNVVILIDDHVVGVLPLSQPLTLPAGEHRFVLEQNAQRLEDRVTVMAGRFAELRCQFHLGVIVVTLLPALLLLTDYPGLSGAPQKQVEQAVTQVTGGAHLGLLQRKDALVQAPKLADCLDTLVCGVELATQNLVQYVLTLKATLRAGTPADWQLQAALLDASVGDVAAELQQDCPACAAERVAELLAQSATQVLARGIGRKSGILAIESTPVGAQVLAGERSLGVTPLRRAQWVGPLALTLRHPGYRTQRVNVTLAAGQTAGLNLVLQPGSDIAVPRRTVTRMEVLPRPRWRLAVGGAALGVGVGLLGLGISALTVNGQCVPDSFVGSQCKNLYTTDGIGAGLGIGGAVFLAGGVVLLALPGRRHQVVVTLDSPPGG